MRHNKKSPHWHMGILAFCLISGILAFSSCEKIGMAETYSYTTFSVDVVYADTTYTFTYNGDTLEKYSGTSNYVPLEIGREDSVGVFRAYRGGDSLELDTTIHISPKDTLAFIQLPGQKITFYDADATESEDAPTDTTCTKARFTYASTYSTYDSLRFVWLSSTKASLSLPGATSASFDTVVVYRNKFSAYVEFDSDKYSAAGYSTYFYYIRQTWGGTAWTGSTKTKLTDTTLTGATYKFVTYSWSQGFLFGTEW